MSFKQGLLLASLCLLPLRMPAEPAGMPERLVSIAERRFPGARLERRSVLLSKEQAEAIERASGTSLPRRLVSRYGVITDRGPAAMFYLDAHRVRTLPQILLVAVDPGGTILFLDVLSFQEPREYLAPDRWYERFAAFSTDRPPVLKRGIDGVTGATLTARATTEAARRVLATHEILSNAGEP